MSPQRGTTPGPSKPDRVVRKDYHLRLSEAEKAEFDEVAREEGFTSAGAWLRVLGKKRVEERRLLDGNTPGAVRRFFEHTGYK